MSKKPIIVFEGIEGSGKTHHIKIIENHLKRKKIKYIKIREPGGSPNSEKIRKLILSNKSNFNKNTDLLLYLAARSENMNEIIKSYKKKIILIDRFIDSTIAYQHYGMGVDLKIINFINNYLLRNIKVDFTFLHLVNKKNLYLRLNLRKKLNRYDKFDFKFYKKAQDGFIKIAKKNKNKYSLIDSNLDFKFNKETIIKKIKKII